MEQLFIQTYNLMWTSLPIIAYGIFDQFAPAKTLMGWPAAYAHGRLDKAYRSNFLPTLLCAFWHSLVVFFIPFWVYPATAGQDILSFGTIQFYSCVLIDTAVIGLVLSSIVRVPLFLFLANKRACSLQYDYTHLDLDSRIILCFEHCWSSVFYIDLRFNAIRGNCARSLWCYSKGYPGR